MSPRKTGQEAKVERLTWFIIIAVFLAMSNNNVDGAIIVLVISAILTLSGLYQWRKRWSVGPQVFIIAGIGIVAGAYGIYQPLPIDLSLLAFAQIIAVILFGIITNDS